MVKRVRKRIKTKRYNSKRKCNMNGGGKKPPIHLRMSNANLDLKERRLWRKRQTAEAAAAAAAATENRENFPPPSSFKSGDDKLYRHRLSSSPVDVDENVASPPASPLDDPDKELSGIPPPLELELDPPVSEPESSSSPSPVSPSPSPVVVEGEKPPHFFKKTYFGKINYKFGITVKVCEMVFLCDEKGISFELKNPGYVSKGYFNEYVKKCSSITKDINPPVLKININNSEYEYNKPTISVDLTDKLKSCMGPDDDSFKVVGSLIYNNKDNTFDAKILYGDISIPFSMVQVDVGGGGKKHKRPKKHIKSVKRRRTRRINKQTKIKNNKTKNKNKNKNNKFK